MATLFGQKQKKSFFSNLSGIASICSTAIACISLAYNGFLSLEWTAFIMVGVVVMTAIGNVATKLGISAVAIFLFAKFISHGNEGQFKNMLGAILALLIALIGLYNIIKSIFKKTL
jgi:hypothetical protein